MKFVCIICFIEKSEELCVVTHMNWKNKDKFIILCILNRCHDRTVQRVWGHFLLIKSVRCGMTARYSVTGFNAFNTV